MGENGFGYKRVQDKTGQLKKGCFGSGQNGFGSARVRVGMGSGQNEVRVGSGWLKNVFFKVIVHQGAILLGFDTNRIV
ncbi:hypothetical protein Hanom_Chr06g00544651 [Helianthus anomalus]